MARTRALTATGDMRFGNGQRDFLANSAALVAQKVQTRLGLNVADWFLNLPDGTPWRTDVLGHRTDATRDPAIRARILGTPGVTGLVSYASQLDRIARRWSVQATIATIYGSAPVSTALPLPNVDVRSAR